MDFLPIQTFSRSPPFPIIHPITIHSLFCVSKQSLLRLLPDIRRAPGFTLTRTFRHETLFHLKYGVFFRIFVKEPLSLFHSSALASFPTLLGFLRSIVVFQKIRACDLPRGRLFLVLQLPPSQRCALALASPVNASLEYSHLDHRLVRPYFLILHVGLSWPSFLFTIFLWYSIPGPFLRRFPFCHRCHNKTISFFTSRNATPPSFLSCGPPLDLCFMLGHLLFHAKVFPVFTNHILLLVFSLFFSSFSIP